MIRDSHRGNSVQRGNILRSIDVAFEEIDVRVLFRETFEGWSYGMAGPTPELK
jgi:hypothetical protein